MRRRRKTVKAQPGWETFEVGKVYEVADGVRIKILNIKVNAAGSKPVTLVKYKYLTPERRQGVEEVSLGNFINNVRG